MAAKLFVGSLAYSVTDAELEEFFAAAGQVVSAKVIIDRDTDRSKGFGFVEMSSDDEAKAAIETLDGASIKGKSMAVKQAEEQSRGGGGGHRGGNSGGRDSGRPPRRY